MWQWNICWAGLSSRLVRSRGFRATDTKMTSTLYYTFNWKKINRHRLKVNTFFGSSLALLFGGIAGYSSPPSYPHHVTIKERISLFNITRCQLLFYLNCSWSLFVVAVCVVFVANLIHAFVFFTRIYCLFLTILGIHGPMSRFLFLWWRTCKINYVNIHNMIMFACDLFMLTCNMILLKCNII